MDMVNTRRSWKHLNEQEFKTLKALQEAGLTPTKTSRVTGRSAGTVTVVYRHPTLAAYRAGILASANAKKAKHETGLATPPTLEQLAIDTEPAMPEAEETQLLVVLTRIAIAMEGLVKAWESEPAKKKSIWS